MKTITDLKVLIVDDSSYMHTFIGTILKREGIKHLYHAMNGEEGINLFNEVQPDVVFLDNIMPKTSGLEVLEIIRKSNKESKIIMTSSITSTRSIELSKELGANYYLVKPFIPDMIRTLFNRFFPNNVIVPSPI
ncbi:MAG: response regulator [Bacteroidota bacterium]|nr:response regulator [Bacteroidota bacterium]